MESATFVALSTPPGISGIAVVRCSGPACGGIVHDLFAPHPPPPPRRATFLRYEDSAGQWVDDVLLTHFRGPHSHTGLDLVEIACHGNPLIVSKLLADLCARGCRPAEPGEFTRTAFLNGKMDLCQAEAVADLVHARSDAALHYAHRQLAGEFGSHIGEAVAEAVDLLAEVEMRIDFPDDCPSGWGDVPARLAELRRRLERSVATERHRPAVDGSLAIALFGRPNAGKSSLFNAIVGRDRVLVSEIAGTTRDYVEGEIQLGRWRVRLGDTAGLSTGRDRLEMLSVERSRSAVAAADLVVWVIDAASGDFDEPDGELRGKNGVTVLNKSDLPARITGENESIRSPGWPIISLSALDPDCGERLREFLERRLRATDAFPDGEEVVVTLRQGELLRGALAAIADGEAHLENNSVELVANGLRRALDALREITGERVDGDALDRLFEKFCVGK